MSQSVHKIEKVKTQAKFKVSEYERTVILKRLGNAIEKLREARREIRLAVEAVLRMKRSGDCIADQTLTAVIESSASDGNAWISVETAKKSMKKEAAKPLLLVRSYD